MNNIVYSAIAIYSDVHMFYGLMTLSLLFIHQSRFCLLTVLKMLPFTFRDV